MTASKVPHDPNMTTEMRRFFDDLARVEGRLTKLIDAFPEFATEAEAESGTATDKIQSPLRTVQAIYAFRKLLHVRDVKAAGTSPGVITDLAWRTRTLNTTVTNRIAGASLASDQVTLPSGRYYIEASVPAFETGRHQARWRNVTDGTTTLVGTPEAAGSSDSTSTRSFVMGEFVLTTSKAFELQHYVGNSASGGIAGNFGESEIYSDARIWRISDE